MASRQKGSFSLYAWGFTLIEILVALA
ncbi:MAG: prepilin-type N-terminal cleavage/methylation domain-containing protein, partial [Candidatus Binatia bacterium]